MQKIRQAETPFLPNDFTETKVTTMGNITELVLMQRKAGSCPCRKLDKDNYFDIRTGEVFGYNHIENRAGSLQSVRVTLSKIRALINTNVIEPRNSLWVTLTYSENMKDTKKLYQDYKKFWQRFIYWCVKHDHPSPEYITVQEPQGRGAWHVHAFFIWKEKAPFIPNSEIAKLWQKGFTKTKGVTVVDNVGAYFTAYLADMPLDEMQNLSDAEQFKVMEGNVSLSEKEFVNDEGHVKSKRFVKGGRLYMYPPGMNIVRRSKGILDPVTERMDYSDAKKKVSEATETFSKTYEILNEGVVVNAITKIYYNSKRKNGQ